MRIKKQWIVNGFNDLCRQLGKEVGYGVGQWSLDYTGCYGGWVIVEMLEKGGETHPLMRHRLSTREMNEALEMANLALDMRNTAKLDNAKGE